MKRELKINVLEKEYVYTGEEYALRYEILDTRLEGVKYDLDQISVLGNDMETEAGEYERVLEIESDFYMNIPELIKLKINRATPDVTLTVTEKTLKYERYLTLERTNIA